MRSVILGEVPRVALLCLVSIAATACLPTHRPQSYTPVAGAEEHLGHLLLVNTFHRQQAPIATNIAIVGNGIEWSQESYPASFFGHSSNFYKLYGLPPGTYTIHYDLDTTHSGTDAPGPDPITVSVGLRSVQAVGVSFRRDERGGRISFPSTVRRMPLTGDAMQFVLRSAAAGNDLSWEFLEQLQRNRGGG